MRGSDLLQKTSRAMSTKFKIKLVSSGDKAFTDGKTIQVPALPENISQKDWEIVCGYSEHEVAHVRFSNFNIVEEAESTSVKNLLNLFEDIRIEKLHGSEFIGVRILLQKTVNHVWNKYYVGDSSAHSIEISPFSMLIFEGRRQCVGMELPEIPSFYNDCIDVFGTDIFDKINTLKSTRDALNLARDILKKLEEEKREEEAIDESDESKDSSSDEQGESSESKNKSLDSDDDEESDKSESSESGGSSDGLVEKTDGDGSSEESGEKTLIPSGSNAEGDDSGEHGKMLEEILGDIENYKDLFQQVADELIDISKMAMANDGYVVLTKKYDEIIRVEDYLKRENPKALSKNWRASFDLMRDEPGSIVSAKHKLSSMFLTRILSRWIGDRDNGKINPRALNKLKTGYTSVFREKTKHEDLNTAVTFLVDFSGSMNGRRIRDAMKSVILFLEVLTASKIKCEVLGYTTGEWSSGFKSIATSAKKTGGRYGRRDPLLTYIIKEFDEPYSSRIKQRIGLYNDLDLRENCDGDSVIVAHDRLLARKEKRKILFVLSDGAVANNGDYSAGCKFLHDTAKEIEKAGFVELIGIGFFTSSVKKYYKNHFIIDNTTGSLAEKMCLELKKIFKV